MRIGELLIEQRKLSASDLTRALNEKPSDKRVCSFLIARGLVEFDDASRALGEQKGVACALAKHLAGRDPELAKLIPAELGRSSCALPIGKSSKGAVIVCVRDPATALLRALEQALRSSVLIVVAPASRLEGLVAQAYGTSSEEEFDIDFDTSSDAAVSPFAASPPKGSPAPVRYAESPRAAPAPNMPPLPDMDALDAETIRMSLTDLDDERVDKDPGQSGQIPKAGAALPPPNLPPPVNPPTSPPQKPAAALAAAASPTITKRATLDVGGRKMTRPMSLQMMAVGLEHAPTREAATEVVLSFVATRWNAGIVLAIRAKTAIGYRAHGVIAPDSVTVSLGSPSTVQRAVQTRAVSVETPPGVGQAVLMRALNGPSSPAAAPVLVDAEPVAVIAVGDPIEGSEARDLAVPELAKLAEALGTAYNRIMSAKPPGS